MYTREQQAATAEPVPLWKSILDQTEASLSLAKHVIDARARQSNFVFSPLSIHVLLGLIASGSNGPTRDQILDFVKSKSLDDLHKLFSKRVSMALADGSPVGGPVLSTANGLWVDGSLTLKPGYRNIVENVFKAVAEHVDFQNKAGEVIEEVNAWAERETKGVIKKVVSAESFNSSTRLILANALYFKGAWRRESFDESLTAEREFYLLNGSSVEAPMMSSWKRQYVSFFDGFKVLRLLYKQGEDHTRRFAMYIYLPDARDGLAALTERVCSEPKFIDNHLPRYQETLDEFRVPKFKITFDLEASGLLRELGLVLPFSGGGGGGGLSEMVAGSDPLEVSSMFHKAFVEVNEEGTVAAAVTYSTMLASSCRFGKVRKRLEFVADHPFLFLIREETTALILFIGHLLNPVSTN